MPCATRAIIAVIYMILFLSLCSSPIHADDRQEAGDLDALVAQATENNPIVKASEERWRSTVQKVSQAGSFEDPMMMMRIQNGLISDPFKFNRDRTTAKVIGISQKIPYYGKRDLLRQEAELDAASDRWIIEERRIELRRMVKEAWYQLYFTDRSLETIRKNIAVIEDLTRLSETMYGIGKTEQQEVFKAQIERSKLEDTLITLQQQRYSLVANLNSLAYRPVEMAIATAPDADTTPLHMTAIELEELAFSNRPSVKALEAQIEKTLVSRRLAEKDFFPDVTVSFEYMQREPAEGNSGDDMYSAQLSFNLPVQRERRYAKVAETTAENRKAAEELASLKNQISLAVNDGLARLERSRKQAQLYKQGLLPQAESAVRSAMAAYRTDKAKFTTVLENRITVYNLERDYYRIVAEYQTQVAFLEGIVGTPLPSVRQAAATPADDAHIPDFMKESL